MPNISTITMMAFGATEVDRTPSIQVSHNSLTCSSTTTEPSETIVMHKRRS